MFLFKLIVRAAVTGLAIYLTTLLIPAVSVKTYDGSSELLPVLLTHLIFGAVITLVNMIVVPIVQVLTFPIYLLTLGLFGLVVTAAIFFFLTWFCAEQLGWGILLNGPFIMSGVWAALLLALINWVLNLLFRPVTK